MTTPVQIVSAGGYAYRFNPDTQPRAADRLRAVMRARMVDELTGQPMASRLSVTTPLPGLRSGIRPGGIAGLIGHPGRLYPGLAGAQVTLEMTVAAARYLPRRLVATLGPQPGFPDAFDPHDAGDVAMHRAALRLRGRIVRDNGLERQPLAGADVRLLGVWPVFPPANVDVDSVMQPSDLVSLTAGLYAARTAGTDRLRRRTLGIVPGTQKVLLKRAAAGDRRVRLSDRVNLNAGTLLALDANHPNLAEYIMIAAVDGASTPDQPATITLNYPLRHSHAPDAFAIRATLQASGADNALNRDAIAGDQTVFCVALSGVVDGGVVEIHGSGDPEYHRAVLYSTVADADGYFRLPPIARVARLRLEADRADLAEARTLDVSPDYDFAEQRLDILVP